MTIVYHFGVVGHSYQEGKKMNQFHSLIIHVFSFHGESTKGNWTFQLKKKANPDKPKKLVLRLYANKETSEEFLNVILPGGGGGGLPLKRPTEMENQNGITSPRNTAPPGVTRGKSEYLLDPT